MKQITQPGAYLLYDGRLMIVTGISEGKVIHMVPVDKRKGCPHCNRGEELSVLEDCLNFQNGAEPVPTLDTP